MSREGVIQPLGLLTRPNAYGLFAPGALSTCRNVCMRDKGKITAMPARQSYRANILGAGYTIRRLFPGASSLLGIGDNAGTWKGSWITSGAETAITMTPPPTGLSAPTISTALLQCVKVRDRFIFLTDGGPLVLDSEGASTVRCAGFPAPAFGPYTSTPTNATAIATGKVAAWTCVWRRKQSDGYEVISEPALAFRVANNTGVTVNPTFRVQINASPAFDQIAGDVLELYRTKQVAVGNDPGTVFRLVTAYTITGADIAAQFAALTDTVPDSSLGAELYSNPGRPVPAIIGVGGSYVNTPPAIATDVWNYKGQTFYAVRDLAKYVQFRMPPYFGDLTTTAQRTIGIGVRVVDGNTTAGSPTITGVASTVGVVAGQTIYTTTAGFPGTSKVLSTTVNTVTFDQNATVTAATATSVTDMIEISGTALAMSYPSNVVTHASTRRATVLTDITVYYGEFQGAGYNVAGTFDGFSIILRAPRAYTNTMTVRATNGANYSPPLPEINATVQQGTTDTRNNRLQWSKPQQPEAVPPQQEIEYGTGTHYRGVLAGDGVWLFASDGLRKLSGEQDQYRVDDRDLKLILAGRNAVATLRDRTYAYTNRGLVMIDANGAIDEKFSADVIGDLIPGAAYADTWDTYVTCDELHREVWLTFRSGGSATSYVYSEVTGTFVDVIDGEWSAMAYAEYLLSLAIGFVDSTPDVYYFQPDSSATRMANAQLQFQPINGEDPHTLKQWQEIDLIFEGVTAGPFTITPYYDGSASVDVPVTVSSIESRPNFGVPRSIAIDNALRPGFTLSAGGTSNAWKLCGLSMQYVPLTEDSGQR